MKKILVTGASGYLGGRLCGALLQQQEDYSIRVLVRPTSDLSALPSDPAPEIVYGDITDYRSLLAAFADCHIIFHAAALVEPWLPDPSKFVSVNVGGLRNVLQAVKETKSVEKVIYTSSFFALGPTDGNVADENQVHHEKFFCTEYEKSKVVADKIARQAAYEGLPIVLLYPGVIYGSGKVTAGNIVAKLIEERFNGRLPGYIGYGNDKFSFSHVEDVVDGHIKAMRKGQPGQRYLLTGENASFMHVFDVTAIITETKRPILNIPLWVIEIYGWLSVLFSRITGRLPLISPPTVRVLRHQWAYSCEKAKRELDYNPRNLKEGLEEVLPWLQNLGYIQY